MSLKSIKHLITASAIAFFATIGVSSAFAQMGGVGQLHDEVTWPQTMTVTVGGAANANWQESGSFSVDGLSYDQSHGLANPQFSVGVEIPILKDMMFAPRISYNDYSVQFDQAEGGIQDPLVVSLLTVGLDAMFKYSFNNFHVMAGGELATPVNATYAHSSHIEDATHSTVEIPQKEDYLGALKGGVGYDIPINSGNTIWLTPEAFYTYHLNSATRVNGNELKVTALSGGASLKFALP
ncbi:MAG: hypothetical protein Q8922_10700 [Bacteroidota bacterium]|nr:hypothetical protein [Bacteroidota bacterium]MDP4233009.1 hypothetical protein [Bacteroidota bacterium]MDP4241846.1 hypothetical protein [Bacteroidota bacterium]MDP4288395.1 hypothetical protein [Bacteroidota bacterium]